MGFLERFLDFVEREKIFNPRSKVILAISGGVDSMVLLHVMNAVKDTLGIEIVAAHLNHMLRESAFRDEEFVKERCEELSVELVVERKDVHKFGGRGRSLEDVAREVRYEFLRRVKREVGAECIATAHHLNDLVETMIYRIVRGTGPFGLICMRPRSGDLARPFLAFTRSEIERFAERSGIDYVCDETNEDTSITRNFIRHVIIPEMKKINSSLESSFLRLWRTLIDLEDFVKPVIRNEYEKRIRKLEKGIDFDMTNIRYLDSELIRMATLEQTGRIPEHVKIEEILERGRRKVVFWDDFGAWRSLSKIFVGYLKREPFTVEVSTGILKMGDFEIEVSTGCSKDLWDLSIDNSKISNRLLFRNRKRGDKIGGRKLKDVLIDKRIPAYLRDDIPVLVDGDTPIWVPGVWFDETYTGCGVRFRVLKSPMERR